MKVITLSNKIGNKKTFYFPIDKRGDQRRLGSIHAYPFLPA